MSTIESGSQQAFEAYFATGTAFWTSEDGARTDLVIARSQGDDPLAELDARVKLFREFWHVRGVDWTKRLQQAFVSFEEADPEWFDGRDELPADTRVWTLSEKQTEFPIWRLAIA